VHPACDRGRLCIAVEDSGTGILSASGQPAEAHEIEKIFELGYTSRRAGGSQGEGLGLNWVLHDQSRTCTAEYDPGRRTSPAAGRASS